MANINAKTLARIATIQGMYELAIENFMKDTGEIYNNIVEYYSNKSTLEDFEITDTKLKLNKNFFKDLFQNTSSNLENIDNLIKVNLVDESTFEFMHENTKAILRVGVSELLLKLDIPLKVTLSEYTNIASSMIKDSEIGLINSVLEKASKSIT